MMNSMFVPEIDLMAIRWSSTRKVNDDKALVSKMMLVPNENSDLETIHP
jgi:hypothetical protein